MLAAPANPYVEGTNVFPSAGAARVRRLIQTAWPRGIEYFAAHRPAVLEVSRADGTGTGAVRGGTGAVLRTAADTVHLRIEYVTAMYTLPRLGALRRLCELVICDVPLVGVPDLSDCGRLWRVRLQQVPLEALVANLGSPPALRVVQVLACEAMRGIEPGFVDRATGLQALTVSFGRLLLLSRGHAR